jgi:hypothetical protein
LVAAAVEAAWRRRTEAPLRIVGSYRNIADGSNFYFSGHPATYDLNGPPRTPWVDVNRMRREGVAMVCPVQEDDCMINLLAFAHIFPASSIVSTTLARSYFGTSDTPVTYEILIVPPP